MTWTKFLANPQNTGLSDNIFPYSSATSAWKYHASGAVTTSPTLSSQGSIIFGCMSNQLIGVSTLGQQKWSYNFSNPGIFVGSTGAVDLYDNIYIGLGSDLTSISNLGSFRWSISHSADVQYFASSILLVNNTLYYGLGTSVAAAYTNGTKKWKTSIGGLNSPLQSAPGLTSQGSLIVQNNNGVLYSISSLNGTVEWKRTLQEISSPASASIDHNDNIYISSNINQKVGYVYCFTSTGQMLWNSSLPGLIYATATIGIDNTLYLTCQDSNMYALNHVTGQVLWKFSLGTYFCSSVVIDGNTLYVSCDYLYAVSTSGSLLWRYATLNQNLGNNLGLVSTPCIGSNHFIYVGTETGYFYSINTTQAYLDYKMTSGSTDSGSGITTVVVIISVVIGGTCIGFFTLLLLFYRGKINIDRSFLLVNNLKKSRRESDFDVNDAPTADLNDIYHQNKYDMERKRIVSGNFKSLRALRMDSSGESLLGRGLIEWAEIDLISGTFGSLHSQSIIGKGSYGLVLKAVWNHQLLAQSTEHSDKSGAADSRRNSVGVFSGKKLANVRKRDVAIKIFLYQNDGSNRGSPDGTGSALSHSTFPYGSEKNDLDMTALSVKSRNRQIYDLAWKEYLIMKEAESKVAKDCIVKAYGIADGPLTEKLASIFSADVSAPYIGLVLKYEGGGSLDKLLHPTKGGKMPLSLLEKITMLKDIASAVTELHRVNIVHGDLKPENILLSHHQPPEIRLADFGLADIKEKSLINTADGMSSLEYTTTTRGTRLYCAPEMLVNPYDTSFDERVAKSSKKTDVYAFSIICWEVLCREKPFNQAKSDATLCAVVHQGVRPDLNSMPKELQSSQIVDMVASCWQKDRSKRRSAAECYSVLNHYYLLLSRNHYDIFFSHAWKNKPLLSHVHDYLIRQGYQVWYDQTEMGHDMKESMRSGLINSKVVIICLSSLYQTRENCKFELREALAFDPPKPIIPIIIEANSDEWLSSEFKELCDISNTRVAVELGEIANAPWDSLDEEESGNNEVLLHRLEISLAPLLTQLTKYGCQPSLK